MEQIFDAGCRSYCASSFPGSAEYKRRVQELANSARWCRESWGKLSTICPALLPMSVLLCSRSCFYCRPDSYRDWSCRVLPFVAEPGYWFDTVDDNTTGDDVNSFSPNGCTALVSSLCLLRNMTSLFTALYSYWSSFTSCAVRLIARMVLSA